MSRTAPRTPATAASPKTAMIGRRVGRRATCGYVVGTLARERLIETKLTAGREQYGVGLRLAYWVAQVCDADARDHGRVAEDGWRAGEAVKESNSGAKEKRRDVDGFRRGGQHSGAAGWCQRRGPQRISRRPRLWLGSRACDALSHELDGRVGSRPSGGDVVGKYECWSPSVISAPALGDVESASTGEHGT